MTDVINEGDLNEDKKIIADEEREKMLNKENEAVIIKEANNKIEEIDKIDKEKELEKEKEAEGGGGDEEKPEKETEVLKTGEVEKRKKQLEESQKESKLSSIRVPIGGIKIPGFLRSRSRDKNKDTDGTTEEALDLLESGGQKAEKADKPEKTEGRSFRGTLTRGLDSLAARNPFAKKEPAPGVAETPAAAEGETPGEAPPRPRPLLERIKLPSVAAVLPKRFTRNKEQKDEGDAAATEPLDGEKPASPDADGMESVKLDGEEETGKDAEKAGLAGDVPKRPLHLQLWDRAQQLTRHEKLVVGLVVLLLLILIIVLSATLGGPPPTSPPVVDGKVITTTQCGPVEGKLDGEAFAFLGIPYAAPPVKERRWKPAQALNDISLCWTADPYLAYNESAKKQCWQEDGDNIDGDEDCLYLDLWTPEVRYINPVPVVVLIDVATLRGGPQDTLKPDSHIVKTREVIFVKPNFRVGVLGFLAATPLSTAVHPPTSGNYGLSDILVALQWVQTNIAHFGGDPDQVTLVGHRAGATLVTALTTSPKSKGLFKRVWSSSGSAMFPGLPVQIAQQNQGQAYVSRVCEEANADDAKLQLDCLLRKGVESLMDTVSEVWPQPPRGLPTESELAASNTTQDIQDWLVLDGNILVNHTWSELKEVHVPLVIGTTAQADASESLRRKIGDWDEEITEDGVVREVRNSLLGKLELAEEALSKYNYTRKGYFSMVTDIRTLCPLLVMARTQPTINFYVVTQPRSTENTSLAEVGLDLTAVTGQYRPEGREQRAFVTKMQELFYKFVIDGVLLTPPPSSPVQSVLTIASNKTEWISDYPNCGFWVAKNVVPNYAKRD